MTEDEAWVIEIVARFKGIEAVRQAQPPATWWPSRWRPEPRNRPTYRGDILHCATDFDSWHYGRAVWPKHCRVVARIGERDCIVQPRDIETN
jgi:hypothetical protein